MIFQRGRVYQISDEPQGTFTAPPEGRRRVEAYGAPVFSLGEPYYSEALLPKGYKLIIDWFQEVAADHDYANPGFTRVDNEDSDDDLELHGEGIELDPPKQIEELDDDEE